MQVAELAECYEKHAAALTRFARSLVGPSDAEDVVADAVLGVMRSAPADVVDVQSYLYQPVVNACRKHWRSIGRRERRERITAAAASRSARLDDGRIAVRHSQRPEAETIIYTPAEWQAFVSGVKDGEFDL